MFSKSFLKVLHRHRRNLPEHFEEKRSATARLTGENRIGLRERGKAVPRWSAGNSRTRKVVRLGRLTGRSQRTVAAFAEDCALDFDLVLGGQSRWTWLVAPWIKTDVRCQDEHTVTDELALSGTPLRCRVLSSMLLVGVCALVTFRPSLPPAHPHLMARRILDCSRASCSLSLALLPPSALLRKLVSVSDPLLPLFFVRTWLPLPRNSTWCCTWASSRGQRFRSHLLRGYNQPEYITCGPSTEALCVSRVNGNYECFAVKVWGNI